MTTSVVTRRACREGAMPASPIMKMPSCLTSDRELREAMRIQEVDRHVRKDRGPSRTCPARRQTAAPLVSSVKMTIHVPSATREGFCSRTAFIRFAGDRMRIRQAN